MSAQGYFADFDHEFINQWIILLCQNTLLRRTKKEYYGNLDTKKVVDNRTFRRTVKPFLSNKSIENEKYILVEKEEILTSDSHPLAKEVNDPTLRAIMKSKTS